MVLERAHLLVVDTVHMVKHNYLHELRLETSDNIKNVAFYRNVKARTRLKTAQRVLPS